MLACVIRRVVQAVVGVLVVAFLSFLLFNYVGDPVSNMVGQDASLADREAMREALGLNDPLIVRFAHYIGNALQGDFGISLRLQRSVGDLIAERMPAPMELVFMSAILALTIGIGLGDFPGIKRTTWPNRPNLTVSLLG